MPILERQGAPGSVPRGPSRPDARPSRVQAVPTGQLGLPPRSVPEVAPTPLQRHYVLLSVPVLLLGAIAITALELGAPLSSPLVKLCAIVAAPLLVATTADAIIRIWRSAWAWMAVDRTKGAFRLAWVVVSLVGLFALTGASVVVIVA